MVLKFSHVVAENTPKGQAALKFKELAEKYTNGKVKIEVYPNSSLFGDKQEMDAIALGDVQFIATSMSKFGKYTKKLEVFDLPFMFKDTEALSRFEDSKTGQQLLHSMENRNYLGLAYWHNGLSQMSANKPLLMPADAKGLKFRIQQSDIIAATYEEIGANAQKLAFSEVYQALQVGTVNAQDNTWSNIYSKKFYEVQKDFTESNGRVIDYMVLVNAKWWKGLPADIRAGLSKAMAEATKLNNENADKLNAEAKKKILASGVDQDPRAHARPARGLGRRDASGVEEVREADRQGYYRRCRFCERRKHQLVATGGRGGNRGRRHDKKHKFGGIAGVAAGGGAPCRGRGDRPHPWRDDGADIFAGRAAVRLQLGPRLAARV